MPTWPDAAALLAFLARARRRRSVVAGIEGAAVGAALSMVALTQTTAPVTLSAIGAAAALTGAAAGAWRARRPDRITARLVEARAPACRNVVITAAELLEMPDRVRPDIGTRICRDAVRATQSLSLGRLFPAGRALASAAAVLVGWWLAAWTIAAPSAVPAAVVTGDGTGPAGPAIVALTATVTPPAYSGLEPETLVDPTEVRALEGSQVTLTIQADAARVDVTTADQATTATPDASGTFVATLSVDATRFMALEPFDATGEPGTPRLVTIVADPDVRPRVRITEPGRDLFLPDASTRLTLSVEADDDLALASLALTYTKVSGSGENFDFVSGEVPLSVSRTSPRSWTGTGALALASLELAPGDMVVYRGVAADRRPGALPVESDAFIVEILAPGEAAAEGFAIDDQRDRYALSQRMVLIKTERLAARQATLSADALLEEAQIIAAEQRQVRAEFIFMMGGELSEFGENSDPFLLHEEDEAHGEADILAGRLVNEGRAELTRAVRAMSRAATSLAQAALDEALVAEREAVEALQNAFASSRYILRTLSERESIDLERRLSGTLSEIANGTLSAGVASNDRADDPRRRALGELLTLAASPMPAASSAISLAQAVLAIDPSSETMREIAGRLADAARSLDATGVEEARRHLDAAAVALTRAASASVSVKTNGGPDTRSRLLRGLQADAGSGGGGLR